MLHLQLSQGSGEPVSIAFHTLRLHRPCIVLASPLHCPCITLASPLHCAFIPHYSLQLTHTSLPSSREQLLGVAFQTLCSHHLFPSSAYFFTFVTRTRHFSDVAFVEMHPTSVCQAINSICHASINRTHNILDRIDGALRQKIESRASRLLLVRSLVRQLQCLLCPNFVGPFGLGSAVTLLTGFRAWSNERTKNLRRSMKQDYIRRKRASESRG